MAPLDDLFPKIPKGKNSIKDVFELYKEKKFYYKKVYPGGNLPWMDKPFDFINENPLYGKVDHKGDVVIPKYSLVEGEAKYENIVEANTDSHGARVFDFVAEAYSDLKQNISSLTKAGFLSKEGPIAAFEAKKGFQDFESMNKLQKEIHYFMFVSQYLSKSSSANSGIKYKEMLENAQDFTTFFASYLKAHTKTMPFTMSGIASAFYMSPLATGLCIEIDDQPYDDDKKKHEFLKDPNFNVYRIAARRFGFMIDRNVPWRLVADIRSYKMREYMRLAYERKLIEPRHAQILKKRETEMKSNFPELPKLTDLYQIKGNKWVLKENVVIDLGINDTLEAFRLETENQLYEVSVSVMNETEPFMKTVDMYGAKDPTRDKNNMATCTGDRFKTCSSRVLKFDKYFELYYDVPYLNEVEEIKKIFYKFFLSYYVQNPKIKKKIICTDKNLQTKFIIKETDVKLSTEGQYNEHYSKFYWLKIYFDIKLAENNIKLTKKQYDINLQKILDLATLSKRSGALSGMTTKNSGHDHKYYIDTEGDGVATLAVHPTNSSIFHFHEIKNWVIQEAHSNCYPDCVEGAGPHVHEINDDFLKSLMYINKFVRKKMKGLAQVYGKRGQLREKSIGEMLSEMIQKNTNLFPGSY